MEISKRAQRMPSSPIRKLTKYEEQANSKGIKVYRLNIGQPDIPTPECGLEAVRNIKRKTLEYSPSQGYIGLRQELAKYYLKYGIEISPDEIIVTTGGSEAVLFACMSCLNPGDEIIVTEPSYANYMAFAITCGAVVKSVRTNIDEGFRLPAVEKFEEQITPLTKAILICNPNNPTGYLYTPEEMQQIKELVKKHGLFLFSDEVYRDFIYTNEPYISAFHLEGIEENVIMIDSVSKRYSECGIRIGALITKNRQVREAVMKFAQARLSPPLLGQIVAEASIEVPKEYTEKVYEEYISRRNFLVEGLNRIPGVYSPTRMGELYTMVRLPVVDSEEFCKCCLTDFQYDVLSIMMAPGSGFYTTSGAGKDEVRMAYVLCKEDMAKALTVLEKALEAYNCRK